MKTIRAKRPAPGKGAAKGKAAGAAKKAVAVKPAARTKRTAAGSQAVAKPADKAKRPGKVLAPAVVQPAVVQPAVVQPTVVQPAVVQPAAVQPAVAEPVEPPPARPPAGLLAEIPFHELSRDAASAFVYAALMPDEVLQLVKELGLTSRGFRPEGLGEVERCDLLGDELRAGPESRATVQAVLAKALQEPAFAGSTLDPAAADELLEVAGSDHGLAIALWRLLADPQPAVRLRGAAALDRLAAEWYGPPPKGETGAGGGDRGGEGEPPGDAQVHASPGGRGQPAGGGADAASVKALEEKLRRAEAQAEAHRQRGEERAEKLQAQLKEARGEAARVQDEAARSRQTAEAARGAQAQAEAALLQARASDAATEVARLRGALRDAEVKLHAAEGRTTRAEERLEAAVAAVEAAKVRAEGATPPGPSQAAEAEGEPEEAPGSWLLPVFTPEFYDSMQGWDRRIQRAALKQAFLLSQDWRHPSLRALALEGLPGYYRVRVATDVRLIYRRGERQDAVEICSLIDREDLDRYVRQAKTR